MRSGKGKDREGEEMDVDEDKKGGFGGRMSTSTVKSEPGAGDGEKAAMVNGDREDGKNGMNGQRWKNA